jgi:hypothetical protein
MLKTLGISLVIIVIITVTFHVFQHRSEPAKPNPTPEPFSETIKNNFFRPIFARDELKKIARDPDSVVVEKTSDPELLPLKKNYGQMIGFLVQYRAKNGFGGYERESRWLICNVYGNNVRFLDRGQKP